MNNKGISIYTVIGIVLVILKLVGVISLAWKWVLLPFYGPVIIFLILFIISWIRLTW